MSNPELNHKVWRVGVLAVLSALLFACGGGSGSSGGVNAPAACVVNRAASSVASSPATAAGWTIESGAAQTYTEMLVSSDETINPMRGYHSWNRQETVPQSTPSGVVYIRYMWGDLEPAQDNYDFSQILSEAAAAKAQGRKFAFGIRMMKDYGDSTMYMPAYLYKNAACSNECGFVSVFKYNPLKPETTFVPDWNDPWLQGRARKMLEALRDKLVSAGVDIAWIDVAMVGQWGEWYTRPSVYVSAPMGTKPAGISAITDASKEAFARMHLETFPDRLHLMMALREHKNLLSWSFAQTITSRPVGLRVNCLGRESAPDGRPPYVLGEWRQYPQDLALIQDQWKKAPFVAELCSPDSGVNTVDLDMSRTQIRDFHISTVGNGNVAKGYPILQRWSALTGSEQYGMLMMGREAGYRYVVNSSSVTFNNDGNFRIQATLRNAGNAPSYENWALAAELVDSGGAVLASTPISLDLQQSLGSCSAQNIDQSWNPAIPAAGRYTIRLVARHGSWPMLKWATVERNSDGSLTLATLLRN